MSKESLRKIWDVELDLLEKLKSICKKYDLSYCASSGTLLGAVRHGGFIPWDDDIDVFLPWKDYKRLLEVAPSECQYPYFFQSFLTETEGEASASRLRRSDTTGYTLWEQENVGPEYNKGFLLTFSHSLMFRIRSKRRPFRKRRLCSFGSVCEGV